MWLNFFISLIVLIIFITLLAFLVSSWFIPLAQEELDELLDFYHFHPKEKEK